MGEKEREGWHFLLAVFKATSGRYKGNHGASMGALAFRGQRAYIAESMKIEEDEAKSLVMFIGAIHDIGKATPAFQIQRGFQNSEDLDLLLMEKLEQEGFSGIKDLELTDRGKTPHAYAGEVICRLAGMNRGIASIIVVLYPRSFDGILYK